MHIEKSLEYTKFSLCKHELFLGWIHLQIKPANFPPFQNVLVTVLNVCFKKTGTNSSSDTLLCFVPVFLKQTLHVLIWSFSVIRFYEKILSYALIGNYMCIFILFFYEILNLIYFNNCIWVFAPFINKNLLYQIIDDLIIWWWIFNVL